MNESLTIFIFCISEVIGLLMTLECAIAVLWIVYTELIVYIMYGSESWDLNCNYVKDFKVAWRNVKCVLGRFLIELTMPLYII